MSGPYRFNQESAKSPLDRTASPAQGVSYKTNVNRMKTKKWVTAKKNAYDGDDWGDYDEFDEYGADQQPPAPGPAHAPAPGQRYYAGEERFEPPNRSNTDRSFTEPHRQGSPGKARRNSFETGEEHRAFSTSIAPPQRQTSAADSDIGHEPQDRRDFTPSAMPPPLQTRMSPMPSEIGASPSHTQFPPRKSSIGQTDSPVTSPRSPSDNHSDKPMPFVRPSDIYKRVEEERERERASLDSSRPSVDSLNSPRVKDDLHSPTSDGGRLLPPLETVAERKSEYLPDFDPTFAQNGKQPASSGSQLQSSSDQSPAVSPPSNQAFRSVVDHAFTRTDDQRSIPPTPISKDSGSGMSRSNTDSTAGISPILGRIPGSATSAMKRNQDDGSTPVIAEEPSETSVLPSTSTFTPGPTHFTAPHPLTSHSRNFSSTSIPTPIRGNSPARSPIIAPQKDLPEPTAARIGTASPDKQQNMEGGLSGQSPAYATREADIATAVKNNTGKSASSLAAAEKQSQDAFLESHDAQSSIGDALPRSRSESPSKGRVQALAGKFGDVSGSRRGSTQSNHSRNSVQSWEKSRDNSRAPSPSKGSPSKPSSPVKEFRPHLPGGWESYATTAPTPSDQAERDRGLGFGQDITLAPRKDLDLTPTTAKQPVDKIGADGASDPLSTPKGAGVAMAHPINATVGVDQSSAAPHNLQTDHTKEFSHGDLYTPRPLYLERAESSVSSIPPTPPAKDTPKNEHPPHVPTKDVNTTTPIQQNHTDFFPQISTPPSADDEESDRLRKEIVASLGPVAALDANRTSLQSAGPGANRSSSILPAEYDSYWADGGTHASTGLSQDMERDIPLPSATTAIPTISQAAEQAKLSLLNRFSWEANSPQFAKSDGPSKAVLVPEPIKTSDEDAILSPKIETAAESERQQLSTDLPEPHPGSARTPTKLEPRALSSASPIDRGSLSSPTSEQTKSSGLHVVNSAIDPEAVDLPPRLSADIMSQSRNSEEDHKFFVQEKDRETPNPVISAPISVPKPEPETSTPAQEPTPTSPATGKPLGAREIATINSTTERIATYNKTREHWATHDHGLGGWLTSALEANPDLTTQTAIPVQQTSTGTVRHKHTASHSLLGKLGGSSHNQALGAEQQQYSASAQAPVSTGSPVAGGSPGSAAGFDRRVASRQLEAKGKDLLHTANVLSGKGLTSAKGLFAKGKSRFGREKDPHSLPSSRQASEEPELEATSTTTTPERPLARFSASTDSPRGEKKKRRFSISSLHRRSRPNSIALPNSTSFSNTPKGTPPRELSRVLGEDMSRPHSYHAPDSWNFAPGLAPPALGEDFQPITPRDGLQAQKSRLGILPSPAKSVFSAHDKDAEQDIPPVPALPDSIRLSDDLSHDILQSVIRYATPPIPMGVDGKTVMTGPDLLNTHVNGTKKSEEDVREETPRQAISRFQQPCTVVISGESEVSPQFKAEPKLLADTSSRIDDNSNASQQAHAAPWPLTNNDIKGTLTQAEDEQAFLTASGIASQATEQTNASTPTQDATHFNSEELDDDDQPPQLTYEPFPQIAKPNPDDSLPAYLLSSHLDISDDEDYTKSQNASKGERKGRLLLSIPKTDAKDAVSPLLQPTILSSADLSGNGESRASTPSEELNNKMGGARVGSFTGSSRSYEDDGTRGNLHNPKTRVSGTKSSLGGLQHQMSNSDSNENTPDGLQPGATPAQGVLRPDQLAAGSADGPNNEPRHIGLAVPFQVVHAVEYAASDSSFVSWDRDSIPTNSISGSSQAGEMRDESDLVTPVAKVPRIVQQADQAEKSNNHLTNSAPNVGYYNSHELPMRHVRQQSSDLTVPERSKSMLSMISSMVSDGSTPISPASSNAGRSTPSTIRRMQRDSSARNPLSSEQIPEESMAMNGDRTPTAKNDDDDFDLYADHNGVVKGVHDESGQPLRLAQAQGPQGPQTRGQLQLVKPDLPTGPSASETRDENASTYSTERPMSFISGPTDLEGRPQDQVNQPLQNPTGTIYSSIPPAQIVPQIVQQPNGSIVQSAISSNQPLAQVPIPSTNGSRGIDQQDAKPPAEATPYPPHEPKPAPYAVHLPVMNGQPPQHGQNVSHGVRDPRLYDTSPAQPISQGPSVQGRMMIPDQDPRLQIQPSGPTPISRNEYELQQQMMQRQAQYAHPQIANSQSRPSQVQVQQAPKQQDKPNPKPKFSKVFKGLGSKLQGHSQSAPSPPNATLHPHAQATLIDTNRNSSYQSGVSSTHHEQPLGRPGEQPSPSISPNRPSSNGAESHLSHVSQGSTQVQPTDSRLDLRKPASPAPFQGIPPHLLPQRAPMQGAQPQQYRASTPGAPETGKKKRFSTLGNIFSRNSEGQPKLKKEQKKAQKTQRNSTAPPMQTPTQQWPAQQPQLRPQQPGMPYPPGHYPPGQFRPGQYPPGQYPSGQYPPGQYPPGRQPSQPMRPMGPQFASPQTMSPVSPQNTQSMDPYGLPQHYQQMQPQPRLPPQQQMQGQIQGQPQNQMQGVQPDQGSAYLRTKMLAEQHQAQKALAQSSQAGKPVSGPGNHASSSSFDQQAPQPHGPPSGGYFNPNLTSSLSERGAYQTTQAARPSQEQQRQQPTPNRGVYGAPHAEGQHQQRQQSLVHDEEAYRALQAQHLEQQRLSPGARGQPPHIPQADRGAQQQIQPAPQNAGYSISVDGRQQSQRPPMSTPLVERQQSTQLQQHPSAPNQVYDASRDELLRAHQERQQYEQQQRSQRYADRVQPAPNQRSVSGPLPNHSVQPQAPVPQRHVSSPAEPQYETPQIPAAYNHVSGAFISHREREQQHHYTTAQQPAIRPDQYERQYSDPRMQPLSPQVSAKSQILPNNRTHSDASSVSVVSPITAPIQDDGSNQIPQNQRAQKTRMSSISEVHQGERPWHLSFPEGATEQEIVRARQRQFMQQQFTAQQQQHAERGTRSPSPRTSPNNQSPAPPTAPSPLPQHQGGGFKELLPLSSPQPYSQIQLAHTQLQGEQARSSNSPQPTQVAPTHLEQATQPSTYTLTRTSPPLQPPPPQAQYSPSNRDVAPLQSQGSSVPNGLNSLQNPSNLPPQVPNSPMFPSNQNSRSPTPQDQHHASAAQDQYERSLPQENQHPPPPLQDPRYEETIPDEPPPSYDGPDTPNDGMGKSRPEQSRPPNINTSVEPDTRGRTGEPRQRQPSLGILQHPQPASMAASPQRSSADMGAESLRRQLLQNEEYARLERLQRAQIQRAESQREKQERDAARARARELERSVSGGERVGSIRSVRGSRNGGQAGWERHGSSTRQVFELPAVEDDEPSMRATSYPGQEWVPPVWTDD
ncbi:hypothetical protein GQ44DRAFT_817594 [Phaeosphaeriaceae sp. PMI808]|nr:hypothetical protein GQ44DRAFT_817594 [Phaeosphaeriaceae sp. PMI808]